MQISPEHIKQKKVVGKIGNLPVFYIETHGGLHIFVGNINGKTEVLAAMPHMAIAVWLTEKKCPEIQWNRQELLGVQNG
jgi:hypothetical protein